MPTFTTLGIPAASENGFPTVCAAVRRHLRTHAIAPGDDFTLSFALSDRLPPTGYRLTVSGSAAVVTAAGTIGLFAGAGRFLRTLRYTGDGFTTGDTDIRFHPRKEIVGVYFATHFDNYYMKAPLPALKDYLADLALWGQNTLLVWFDMHSYTDMDDPAARPVLRRLREMLSAAKALGMKTGFTMLANEGFCSTPAEYRAQWQVQNGYHASPCGHYHVEICPGTPGGRALLLANRRAMLSRFADLAPDFFCLWPYDQGGCTCEHCAPWGARGYLSLLPELGALIRSFFPDAALACAGWDFDHFTSGEWDGMFEMAAENPALFTGFCYLGGISTACAHLPPSVQGGMGPAGMGTLGFPEISMRGCTPWGGFGANPYPAALQTEWDQVGHTQAGEWCYSEGIFDDINKAIILSLYTGECATAAEALDAYVRMYFPADQAAPIGEAVALMESTLYREVERGRDKAGTDRVLLRNPGPVQRICDLLTAVDEALPPTLRESLRWRLLIIRARADDALLAGDGLVDTECDGILKELESLYYTDGDTLYTVSPATIAGLKKRFTDPHSEYYV